MREARIEMLPQLLQERMGFEEVLAARVFALVKVGNGVELESIYSHLRPEIEHSHDAALHEWTVKVEIRLVRIEPMPIVSFSDWIPTPVGRLKILKNNTCVGVFVGSVVPHVEVAPTRAGLGCSRLLKPLVLIGSMV